jgi:hypothetical protein
MALTASMKGQAIVSSSTQIQNYDVFALNSNLYNGTGSIKGEVAGIEAYTASLKGAAIVSSSTQIQNYDVFALNSNLYTSTGSIKAEIGGIEAYTASLKGAAIVSSSQQITNYYKFAETASANTFYGNQSISGTLTATGTITMNKTGGYGILAQDNGNNLAANGAYIGWTNIAANRYFIGQLDTNNDLNYHYFNGSTWATSIMKFTNAGGASFADNIVMASGKGIDFSATANSGGTMTSELLNDYEEGTFTPTIKGSTTAGTGTYTVQQGTYTKIGNLVTVNVWLNWSGHTGTGDMLLANFPFTSISTTNYRASGTFGWIENLSLTANNLATMAITPSSTEASVTQYPVGGGAATSVPIDTSANIHFSITYQTA